MKIIILFLALSFGINASASDNACENIKTLVKQMHEISYRIMSAESDQNVDVESEMNVLVGLRQAYEQAKPYCTEQSNQNRQPATNHTCPVLSHIQNRNSIE